jgi:hypothetical protein
MAVAAKALFSFSFSVRYPEQGHHCGAWGGRAGSARIDSLINLTGPSSRGARRVMRGFDTFSLVRLLPHSKANWLYFQRNLSITLDLKENKKHKLRI